MKRIVIFIVFLFSRIWNYRNIQWWNRKVDMLYTYWIMNEFKSFHVGIIQKPLYLCGGENISIGPKFISEKRVRLEAITYWKGQLFMPHIDIGSNVYIKQDCHIGCIDYIKIGDNVLFGSHCLVTDHMHGDSKLFDMLLPPMSRNLISKGPINIGKNVLLGERVAILPGVSIGDNCIIGANAVVTKDIPPNCIAVGNPARVLLNQNIK